MEIASLKYGKFTEHLFSVVNFMFLIIRQGQWNSWESIHAHPIIQIQTLLQFQ